MDGLDFFWCRLEIVKFQENGRQEALNRKVHALIFGGLGEDSLALPDFPIYHLVKFIEIDNRYHIAQGANPKKGVLPFFLATKVQNPSADLSSYNRLSLIFKLQFS